MDPTPTRLSQDRSLQSTQAIQTTQSLNTLSNCKTSVRTKRASFPIMLLTNRWQQWLVVLKWVPWLTRLLVSSITRSKIASQASMGSRCLSWLEGDLNPKSTLSPCSSLKPRLSLLKMLQVRVSLMRNSRLKLSFNPMITTEVSRLVVRRRTLTSQEVEW